MAYFYNFDLSDGWWFYIIMCMAQSDDEIRKDFIAELNVLLTKENVGVHEPNDTQQKRIQMRKMRGKIY